MIDDISSNAKRAASPPDTIGPAVAHVRRRGAGGLMAPKRVARAGPRRPPVRRFIEAALAGDDDGAAALAVAYLSVRGSRTDVSTDLLYGAQRQVDDLWHVGEATAEEELAVARAVEVALEELDRAAPSAPRADPRRHALLATIEPDPHDLGLRMLAAALRDDGWTVDLLPRVTFPELEARVAPGRYQLAALSLSWDSAELRLRLREVAQHLKRHAVPVLLGGVAPERHPGVVALIHPDAVPADAREAVTAARRLLRRR